jgi:SulP family sulfate permease
VYGAILVGFFAALFGGTPSQISGPTGPMIVVFAGVFASLSGDLSLVFATVILAGLIQILFGVLGFGQYIRLVPYPVVSGFMSGIGCIIIALQLARLFGHEPEGSGTIPALLEVPNAVSNPNIEALGIGVLTLVMVFLWPASWGRYMPGPLAALIVGTVVSLGLSNVPVLGAIPTGLPEFIMPSLSNDTVLIVFEAALILAVLGAIDSLLTSLVADNMTRTRHRSNRELIGQGVGNVACWILWRHSGRRRHHADRGQHSHRGRHQDFRHAAQSAVARRGTHLGAAGIKNPPRCTSRYFGQGGL